MTASLCAVSMPIPRPSGGIIIPDSAKEKPSQGEVVAVGPGGRDEAGKLVTISVKAGDKVLFGKWWGTEVKLDGEELLIMKESDIMGIVGWHPNTRFHLRLILRDASRRRSSG